MIVFPAMLIPAAHDAGMEYPNFDKLDEEDIEEWKADFPHFAVFCILQLNRPMATPGQHWGNAEVIAGIEKQKIFLMTLEEFVTAGVDIS
jgi:hypothetical protein